MSKPVILTGIRANNDLHIGNYFGALLPMVDMATRRAGEYQINLFVPDLHSFTTLIDHSKLYGQILHNLRLFVAAGLPLDNPDIHIYRQSYIPAHSELTWILDCFTGFGEMRRMQAFEEKAGLLLDGSYENPNPKTIWHKIREINGFRKSDGSFNAPEQVTREYLADLIASIGPLLNSYETVLARYELNNGRLGHVSVGLFNYPVLMAADILLYGATYVPVGEDQTQHLEFTRDIAERMNTRFGQLFVVPKPVKDQHEFFGKDQGLRIKDLVDPTKKMSKSDESGRGIIFLGDNPDAAAKKIMGATTDSVGAIHLDRDKQPGIANLLQILALLREQPLDDVAHEYEGKTSYGELKAEVAEKTRNFLSEFQKRLSEVDDAAVQAKLQASEAAMRETANRTLAKVQRAVGLRPQVSASQDEDVVAYCQELSELGIENSVLEHSSTRKIAEVVAELGLEISDSLPTLIMKSGDKFLAVVTRGDTKIDMEKIQAAAGSDDIRMATKEEFVDFTHVPVGAARVYNPGAETIIDQQVFEGEYLVGGSGRFDCSVRYKTADLKKIPGVRVADITL